MVYVYSYFHSTGQYIETRAPLPHTTTLLLLHTVTPQLWCNRALHERLALISLHLSLTYDTATCNDF